MARDFSCHWRLTDAVTREQLQAAADVSDGGRMQKAQDQARRQPARAGDRASRRRPTVRCVWHALLWCTLSVGARTAFVHTDDHSGSAGPGVDDTVEQVCEDAYDPRGPDCSGEAGDGPAPGADDGDQRTGLAAPDRVPAVHARQGL